MSMIRKIIITITLIIVGVLVATFLVIGIATIDLPYEEEFQVKLIK